MRKIEEINQEYADLCAKLGQINYQIMCYEDEMELLRQRISYIAKEAKELPKKEEKKEEKL